MQVPAGNLLEKINLPSDLKQLKVDELNQVCQELRQYIIDVVSVNGGHFADQPWRCRAYRCFTIRFKHPPMTNWYGMLGTRLTAIKY